VNDREVTFHDLTTVEKRSLVARHTMMPCARGLRPMSHGTVIALFIGLGPISPVSSQHYFIGAGGTKRKMDN